MSKPYTPLKAIEKIIGRPVTLHELAINEDSLVRKLRCLSYSWHTGDETDNESIHKYTHYRRRTIRRFYKSMPRHD